MKILVKNIFTDLALEIAENIGAKDSPNGGVSVETEERNDITITTVGITNQEASLAMGKPIGNYITIESETMKQNDIMAHEEIMGILAQKLAFLCKEQKNQETLVIGLGNRYVTPDALGPKVISKVLVTRHIMEILPKELDGNVRSLCGIAPGVMGMTGMETAEVVRGLIDNIKPKLVIVIDALAARRTNRINCAIQLSDTGIAPGAGVGNKRMALSQETLGVPVVAIGVPTVVDAATLVNDTMDIMTESMLNNIPKDMEKATDFIQMLTKMGNTEKYGAIKQSLDNNIGNMFVTPKEIGDVVNWLANIIANGINMAMHSGIDREDINRFMY